jgi:hypothetical protein
MKMATILFGFMVYASLLAQVAVTAGNDCVNCEGNSPNLNGGGIPNLMEHMTPSPELVELVCDIYQNSTRLEIVDTVLVRNGWTLEDFHRNYDKFVCFRNRLPITHRVRDSQTIDIRHLVRDLVYLEELPEEQRFPLVNRVFSPRPTVRQTQLDMINQRIHYLDSAPPTTVAEEMYDKAIREVHARFIKMGAKTFNDLSPAERARLGFP